MFFYKFTKRLFDICASAVVLVITLPIWIVTIIGIELSDPGPVFYMARRVGKNNKVFKMYKFRSMRVDTNANENGFKADTDRIFPFGRFIRASKIDELPQLLNILVGTMSIVGPRPAAVDQVEIVRSGENAVVSTVTTGLTGPSALYDYIYGDTIEDEEEYREKVLPTRLALDVWYVNKRCGLLDIKMIFLTVICVLAEIFHKKTPRIYNELVGYVDADIKVGK